MLNEQTPKPLVANASRANKNAYQKLLDNAIDVGCLMLATMNSEL